jgi:hypothetical protein
MADNYANWFPSQGAVPHEPNAMDWIGTLLSTGPLLGLGFTQSTLPFSHTKSFPALAEDSANYQNRVDTLRQFGAGNKDSGRSGASRQAPKSPPKSKEGSGTVKRQYLDGKKKSSANVEVMKKYLSENQKKAK